MDLNGATDAYFSIDEFVLRALHLCTLHLLYINKSLH